MEWNSLGLPNEGGTCSCPLGGLVSWMPNFPHALRGEHWHLIRDKYPQPPLASSKNPPPPHHPVQRAGLESSKSFWQLLSTFSSTWNAVTSALWFSSYPSEVQKKFSPSPPEVLMCESGRPQHVWWGVFIATNAIGYPFQGDIKLQQILTKMPSLDIVPNVK